MCVIIFSAPGYHHFSFRCSDIYKTMCILKLARFRISEYHTRFESHFDIILASVFQCFFFGFGTMKFMILKSFPVSGTHLGKEAHFEDISVFC